MRRIGKIWINITIYKIFARSLCNFLRIFYVISSSYLMIMDYMSYIMCDLQKRWRETVKNSRNRMVSVNVTPVAVSHDVTGLGRYQGLFNTILRKLLFRLYLRLLK